MTRGLPGAVPQYQGYLDERSVGILHILRAAPVVIAVLLNELERIGVPIGAQSLHNVNVAKKQDRLFGGLACGANAHHEILFTRVRPEQAHVLRREAGIQEALLHGDRRIGHVASRRISGIDFDELLEYFARLGAIGCRRRRQ